VSDGRGEYKLMAPELMRNSWVEQVSIEDKEVKPLGGLYAVEFDDEGEIDIYFVPIRPGTYEFYVDRAWTSWLAVPRSRVTGPGIRREVLGGALRTDCQTNGFPLSPRRRTSMKEGCNGEL
jgi:hypothetical protein